MPLHRHLALIPLLLSLTAAPVRAATPTPPAHPLTIHPASTEDWKAPAKDVEKLLTSAASQLWVHFPERNLPPILVEPKGGPITLYQRGPAGEYRIRLNTGGLLWCQYAYQFAHEFCHILCNCRPSDPSNKWFEESLCELASIYTLRAMARTWRTTPPYPNWRDYSSKLDQYAQNLITQGALPPAQTLAAWLKENLPLLRANATLREKNRIVAVALLPLFEKSPEHWEAVGYLNAADNGTSRTFEVFLADWYAQSPQKHKPFIRELAEKLGINAIPE